MIVAATGHRPGKLGGYSEAAKSRLRRLATVFLQDGSPDRVVTGMALGWDTAVAEAALLLGIPFTAAVPCDGQDARWPEQTRSHYRQLLLKAAKIEVVSPGPYSPGKMQARNEWMVDNCDLVLALWNGTKGGTANCIAYATRRRRPLVNLWEIYAAMTSIDEYRPGML